MTNITPDAKVVAQFVPKSLPVEIAEELKVFPVGGRYALASNVLPPSEFD